MFSSLRLGKFFGIDLYIHNTFWLLPLFVLFGDLSSGANLAEAGVEIAFVFAIFGCVVLHEIGHALAARSYGIGTRDITLYPVGGVAALERMPEKPWREIAIALAGPAVNVVIAGALFAGLIGGYVLNPWSAVSGPDEIEVFAARLMWANVILGAFNLLPCFPMDGGRVLRAVLALRMSRVRATATAVSVGSVVAGALVVAGVLIPQFTLIVLAVVVYLLGQAELAGVRAQAATRDVRDWESATPERGYSGLVWDAGRRLWIQYENGSVVRVIDPDRPDGQ
jgi:Zn-dependent protease